MDGEPVEDGEPSIEYSTFTEVFIKLCPYYMEMGMSYHDYWHMNTSCHKAYREAYEIRRRNGEWARWRQGAYFFNALMCAAPVLRAFSKTTEPGKYPDEPWPLTEAEYRRKQQEREEENYRRYIERMEEASNRELERRRQAREASEDGRD